MINVTRWKISGSTQLAAPGPEAKGNMTVGSTATSAGAPPAAPGEYFRIAGDEAFRFEVGVGAEADATSAYMEAGQVEHIGPLQGNEVISVIQP